MYPASALRRASLLSGVAACALWSAQAAAQSLPTGGHVTAGNAAISQPSATSMLINQSSTTGIIGWQSFSIGSGNQVRFENGAGMTLNRVTGNVPSSINGLLSASGSVYLVNPSGVTVGANGIVQTGGSFVASTLDVTDKNFLGGNLTFSGTSQSAVVNLGKIGSSNGDIFLIARTVQNDGTLTAKNGKVGLASGSEVVVTDGSLGNGKIMVRLPANGGEVKNRGRIRAAEIELRANGGNVLALAGNTKSIIKATGVANKGGRIFLTAEGGSVTATQKIVARNRNTTVATRRQGVTAGVATKTAADGGQVFVAGDSVSLNGPVIANGRNGGAGGTIIVIGNDLTLGAGALLDASGKIGGTILIGGDRAGGNDPSVKFVTQQIANAQTTTVLSGATIKANGADGNGGSIVVWSDGSTSVAGTLTATGTGGGFVETSGHTLSVAGAKVNAGKGGQWLLDPYDLDIDSASAVTISNTLTGGTDVLVQTTANGSSGPGVANPLGNGDITVSASVNWTSAATLTLSAYRHIGINDGVTISNSGGGNLILRADNTGIGIGTVSFNTTGAVNFSAGGTVSIYYNPPGNDPTTVNGTSYTTPTDYTPFVTLAGGATLTTSMLVNTVYDLQNINNNLAANYALGRDIDASITGTASWPDSAGFVPLGTDGAGTVQNGGNGFAGIFSGQGQVISGLTVNRPSADNVGLIGYMTRSLVSNIGLVGGSISGRFYVGGLVGRSDRSTVQQSYVTGAVNGDVSVGGLVGYNIFGLVQQSYATGAVIGGATVGGLVGYNAGGTVQQSYATGAVNGPGAAGLVAANDGGTVANSYWDTYTTGRLIGVALNTNIVTNVNPVTSDPAHSGDANYAYKQSAYDIASGGSFTFTTTPGATGWFMIEGQTRPFGAWEYSTTIGNSHQLQLVNMDLNASYRLANNINLGPDLAAVGGKYPGMWTAAGFVPIGTDGAGNIQNGSNGFAGTFDGQSKVISNLTIDRLSTFTNYVGLFGYLSGTIRNVGLEGGSVTGDVFVGGLIGFSNGAVDQSYATGAVSGSDYIGGLVGYNNGSRSVQLSYATGAVTGSGIVGYVGGLVGYNAGTVQQSYATGAVTSDGNFVGGLVGYNYHTGTVQQSNAAGAVTGSRDVGGLVGYNDFGTVQQSYATGAVTGSDFYVGGLIGSNVAGGGTLQQSYATGTVTGTSYVGGLVGSNGGAVQQSYAVGAVTGTGDYVGGLVGANGGPVQQSYAIGAVIGTNNVGGLIGWNHSGTVQQSYALGTVIGNNNVGGLVGLNDTGGTVTQTYSTGAVTGATNFGGLVGQNNATVTASYWDTQTSGTTSGIGNDPNNTGATGLTSAQFRTASNMPALTFTTTPGAAGFVIVDADSTFNNAGGGAGATRPFLASEYTTNIVNTHQLQLVGLAPSAAYTLGASIEAARDFAPMTGQYLGGPLYPGMWDASGFVPIGTATNAFHGSFDGQNNYIAGLTINRPTTDNVGLFGFVCNCGSISNLGLIDATVTGQNNVGALVGTNLGTITNVYAIGPNDNSGGTGTVTGMARVGGLVGWNGGTITKSYTSNEVDGASQLGGLVGQNDNAISNSYSATTVFDNTTAGNAADVGGLVGLNNGTITQTWASGFLDIGLGATAVGGLVGRNNPIGVVTQSYWDSDTTGASLGVAVNGGTVTNVNSVDSTTAFSQASYANLDFVNTWYMIDGQTRPFLRNEYSTSIATPHQLQLMSMDLTASYKLVRDIDFGTAYNNISEMWSGAGFVPLGTDGAGTIFNGGNGFTGTFDGKGHVIAGLVINSPSSDVGLFGVTSGTISNVGLLGADITGSNDVGALAGTLQNGGTIWQSYATGAVNGSTFVGGLVGLSLLGGPITQVYAAVDVSGQSGVGGLVGKNYTSVISFAYATGSVAASGDASGGLVGFNGGTIAQSWASGSVTATTNAGGLVGNNAGTFTASLWDTTTTGQNSPVGTGNAAGAFPVQSANPASPTDYAYSQTPYLGQGWTFGGGGNWFLIEGQTRPFGQWEYSTSVGNSHQLQLVSMNLGANYALRRNIDLVADPAGMWTAAGFVPIGPGGFGNPTFTGAFDGQNHVISNLFINQPAGSNIGLFGEIGSTGVVHDLGLQSATIAGLANVGTLAGTNNGVVVNSYAAVSPCGCFGEVDAAGSADQVGGLVGQNGGLLNFVHSDVAVIGTSDTTNMGGLVGYATGGTIRNSYATGPVIGDPTNPNSGYIGGLIGNTNAGVVVENVYATGDVAGYNNVGGLIGANSGAVTNAFATGNVIGSLFVGGLIGFNDNDNPQGDGTLTRVFATGSVSGDSGSSALGGLVGYNNGRITDAYATGAVQGGDYVGGLTGVNVGEVTNAYATGWVSLASGATSTNIGALVGENDGSLTNAYWNTETSGQTQAVGPNDAGSTTFGKTTALLQLGLAGLGFDTSVWGLVPGISYPYLNWRFPSGTTVVSGTASNILGGNAGLYVNLAVNGTQLANQVTGANGYYHFMVDPQAPGAGALTWIGDTRFGSGDLVPFTNSSTAVAALSAQSHATGLDLQRSRVFVRTDVATLTEILTLMSKAEGSLFDQNILYFVTCNCSPQLVLAPNASLRIENGPTALTLDLPLSVPRDLQVIAGGSLTVGTSINIDAGRSTLMTTPGNLTINSGATITAGTGVTLAATGLTSAFINNEGSDAVQVASGRFLIYSADPSLDTFGSLDSGHTAIWGATYASLPNPTQSGNRYLFALQPTLTVTADDKQKTYGDTAALTYSLSGLRPGVTGAFLADTATSVFSGTPTLTSAGTATGASVAGNPYGIGVDTTSMTALNGYQFAAVNGALTVDPRSITVTADTLSKIYGDANPALTYQVGGLGLVNGDALAGALATGATAASGVGAYGISQNTLTSANNPNYAITYTGANLTIGTRSITVTADAQSCIYGNANPALTYVVGGLGLANGDLLGGGLATSATAASGVGTYGIAQNTLTNANNPNYAIAYTGANLTIDPRAITVTADTLSKIYGNANPALTYQVGGLGLVNGDALAGALATGATAASGVGAYAITQNTLTNASNPNYAITYTGANLTIDPRAITVTADTLSKIYGNANPALTYQVGGLGLANGDALAGALATGATTASSVGTYGITQNTLTSANNPNYAIAYTGTNLTITQRPITVTADAKAKIYGNADPALTYLITSGNLVGSDSLTGALARSAGENVGTYAINQNTLANANYAISYAGASFGITPAPLLIAANDASRLTGQPNPLFNATITGFVAGDTPGVISGLSLTSPADTASLAGAYPIVAAGASASNYTISFKNGVLTVKESGPATPPLPSGLFGTYFQVLLTAPGWPANEPPADSSTTQCTAPPLGGGCAGLPYPDNRQIGSWIIFAGP